jgi:diguanylate cyclase (GGDEF)-like protein
MQTYEILFANKYVRDIFGDVVGKTCWQTLQADQTSPCPFCTNEKLVSPDGEPTGVYAWEFQNTVNGHWYDIRDRAIKWVDGRLVRLEIATDITERKKMEEELKKLATTDSLTQAYNRTKFDELVSMEVERVKRFDHPLSIIMFDIDNFKEVNDTYGHLAGDDVLKTIAVLVRKEMRKIDHFIRWGGEEFMIIAPETDLQRAEALTERIRKVVVSYRFDKVGRVTASFGVAEFRKDDSVDSFIKRADDALYIAKSKGRDRVEICV